MKILNKKNDLKSTIPFMALFVSLNLLITVFSTYLPLSGFILILFLPLISNLYCIHTKKRYFPIYFAISFGLAICFSLQDLTSTLLYLLPALLQGFFFSLFIDLDKDGALSYFTSVVILFITKISMIPIIDFIYSINTIDSILTILALKNLENIHLLIYGAIFILCSFEMLIVFIITKGELEKLGYKINFFSEISIILSAVSNLSSCLAMLCSFINSYKISYIFLAVSVVSTILIVIPLIKKNILIFSLVTSFIIIATWMIFVFSLKHLEILNAISMFSIFGICMSLICNIYLLYVSLKKDNQNKNERSI